MKKYKLLIILNAYCALVSAQPKQTWKYLPAGPHTIGFKVMRTTSNQNDSLSIGIWYPSEKGNERMSLKDYITESRETPTTPDSVVLNDFKRIIELPFLYHLPKIPAADFSKAVDVPFSAYKNAMVKKGKFPLVIMFAQPQSYPETCEFLASHGFVVACVTARLGQPPNDTLLYVHATDILGEVVNIMSKQPYVDAARIAAIGHGWGIQAPFYLAMRTPAIKLLVNLDGGVFSLRSKTTLSPDYAPAKLKIPMLHTVTSSTNAEDDAAQFNALSNPVYKLLISSPAVAHHDFTEYGRVVDLGLGKRGDDAPLAEEAYAAVHNAILYFLEHGQLQAGAVPASLLTYTEFNKK